MSEHTDNPANRRHELLFKQIMNEVVVGHPKLLTDAVTIKHFCDGTFHSIHFGTLIDHA